MKKQISLFVYAFTILAIMPAFADTNFGTRAASSVDLTGQPSVR